MLFAYSILLLTCLEYLIFAKIFICTPRQECKWLMYFTRSARICVPVFARRAMTQWANDWLTKSVRVKHIEKYVVCVRGVLHCHTLKSFFVLSKPKTEKKEDETWRWSKMHKIPPLHTNSLTHSPHKPTTDGLIYDILSVLYMEISIGIKITKEIL